MHIKLCPGQIVYIHSWMTPKPFLHWDDVVSDPKLNLRYLLSANLNLRDLHKLQPDASAWVKHRKADLAELWAAHPVAEFRADLGDVVNQRWSAEQMATMGLHYSDQVDLGLTSFSMGLFTNLTLLGWAHLGLQRQHVEAVPEATLVRLFGMAKQDVMCSLLKRVKQIHVTGPGG
jgi:hypothetical protein